ncbi:carbamoyltransferase HypF [Gilliamella sp. wkB108]|uniref:carbamoyltransferase HypF n=1 Tax=Gilliamella sp. wkB108 TaxID=3120256 RepID=UPI00080E58C4|nr:carbamoyltransferase HypF [Gilliamella apicola]OCG26034.1 carbamoyltransferase HypF [Gilliamella apicola]
MTYNGCEIRVKGKVQGVGFRPFVWQLATELRFFGNVSNDSQGVLIHLYSHPHETNHFIKQLKQRCPPLAKIDSIAIDQYQWHQPPNQFTIIPSQNGKIDTLIVPDAATCESCIQELNTTDDRRYHYPFINCTHCGPRFTIIKKIPYDRPNTIMAKFKLCPICQQEYDDPHDRRFHAQPTACPDCGPQIWVSSANGNVLAERARSIDFIVKKLEHGHIIAIKGIGGFHLACDALQDQVVQQLRQRKYRPHKPLAIMLPNESWLSQCVRPDIDLASLVQQLKSPAAPIVLVPNHPNSPISQYIAPDLNEIGIMLPSNPLHHLLLQRYQKPLVMTSGNINNHPPALTNEQALSTLKTVADYWLLHDRDIIQRADDSVIKINANKLETFRRARGYVPDVVDVPIDFNSSLSILAMGADRKNTFCLLKSSQAIVSQHFGNLTTPNISQQYQDTLNLWLKIYQPKLDLIVVDAHPNYVSHSLGLALSQRLNIPLLPVYHHHAHIAACLAEHHYPLQGKPVVGIVLDGLGYGSNQSLWGGECLITDYKSCQHFGGLPAVALPGGDLAAKQPWRNLLAHLIKFVDNWSQIAEVRNIPAENIGLLSQAIQQNINCPLASSAGRLFDAVAAALGIAPTQISWEGEAACKLENIARQYQGTCPTIAIPLNDDMTLDLKTFWQQWLNLEATTAERAYAFHVALANGMAKLAKIAAQQHQLSTIVLSGGVMHNQLLRQLIQQALPNYQLLFPSKFPANDGGIALGQAIIASALNKP